MMFPRLQSCVCRYKHTAGSLTVRSPPYSYVIHLRGFGEVYVKHTLRSTSDLHKKGERAEGRKDVLKNVEGFWGC